MVGRECACQRMRGSSTCLTRGRALPPSLDAGDVRREDTAQDSPAATTGVCAVQHAAVRFALRPIPQRPELSLRELSDAWGLPILANAMVCRVHLMYCRPARDSFLFLSFPPFQSPAWPRVPRQVYRVARSMRVGFDSQASWPPPPLFFVGHFLLARALAHFRRSGVQPGVWEHRWVLQCASAGRLLSCGGRSTCRPAW